MIRPDVKNIITALDARLKSEKRSILSFEDFLLKVAENPVQVLRGVFQLFYDFVKDGVSEEEEEYPDDPESIGFVKYNCRKLLVENMDNPFFIDRLFANRFVRMIEQMKTGAAQQNKIYAFRGPHGCGKSTFFNNLMAGFGRYTDRPEGEIFEIVWKIDANEEKNLEIPCPSHDNPLLVFPKQIRRDLLSGVLGDQEIKNNILCNKEYEWLLNGACCPICRSLFYSLLEKLGSFEKVQKSIFARSYKFDRILGEGISVFSPGDRPSKQAFLIDEGLQKRIDDFFGSSNIVRYIFSRYAKTNNGIYALMDIKEYNKERFAELHGIVSEGIHKLDECIEEGVKSLFLVVANPEDVVVEKEDSGEKKHEHGLVIDEAFFDRITYIDVPYVTEVEAEVSVYKSVFGKNIVYNFLPDVLENFARIIISSRLIRESSALKGWLGDISKKYSKYCDKDGLLLKMSIYGGVKPSWLASEDVKAFTKEHRRELILKEGEKEGARGFSGRDSISLFNSFYYFYAARPDRLITMADVDRFFRDRFKDHPEYKEIVPKDFLDSLRGWYNYTVVQQIKESLYDYNEERIKKDILHYIFAVSQEENSRVTCLYTGETIEITEDFLRVVEDHFLTDSKTTDDDRKFYREDVVEEHARLLAQSGRSLRIENTKLFKEIYETYIGQLKEKVMEPFLKNKSFREAVKVCGQKEFGTFDSRVKESVLLMIGKLCKLFGYTEQGAKEVCIYVLDDEEILKKFAN